MSSSIDRQIEEIRIRHLAKKRAAAARRLACDSTDADIALFRSKRRARLQARLDSAADSAERKRLRRAIRRDADGEDEVWITVHPNGGTGVPIRIEESTGEVVGGAGGAMNGTVLSEAESQPLSELQKSSSGQSESGSSSSSGSSSTSGGSIAANANLTERITADLDYLFETKARNNGSVKGLGLSRSTREELSTIKKALSQNLDYLPRGTVVSIYNSETGETDLYESKYTPWGNFVNSSGREFYSSDLADKIFDTLSSADEIKVYDKEDADVVMGRKTMEEQQTYKQQQEEEKANRLKVYDGLSDSQPISSLPVGGVVISSSGQMWMKTRAEQEMTYSDYVEEYGEPDEDEELDVYDDTVFVDCEYVNLATGTSRGAVEDKNRIAGEQVRVYSPYKGSADVVEGKDISDTYEAVGDNLEVGTYEIENVLEQQGFNGLPRIVSPDEFDDAVSLGGVTVVDENGNETKRSFIAQRIYCAQSQEELDSYENDFYYGKFYVSCEVGGHSEGRGMYCAASVTGELSGDVSTEMENYERLGYQKQLIQTVSAANESNGVSDELMFACAMISSGHKNAAYFENQYERHGESAFESRFGFDYSCVEAYNEFVSTASQEEKDSLLNEAEEIVSDVKSTFKCYSKVETLTLDPSARLITFDAICKMIANESDPKYSSDDFDIGTYAAIKGYDGIYADNGVGYTNAAYTVVLNRTKLIIQGEYEEGKNDTYTYKNRKDIYKQLSKGTENTDSSGKTTKRKKRRKKNMSGNITFEYNQKTGMMDSYKDGKKIGSVYASCGADPEDRMAAKKLRKDRKTGRSRKARK